jgi:tetratricopeptide (TPR) repeat protein
MAAHSLRARTRRWGELALGPEGFKEYDGHFWGFLETRPYMRARHGLALALLKLGEEEEAMKHFRAMLKLNPGDNQGIRYLLLGCLLKRNEPVTSHSGYITMGGADEATDYVRDCGPAWRQTPGAVAWLNQLVAALPKKPRTSGTVH